MPYTPEERRRRSAAMYDARRRHPEAFQRGAELGSRMSHDVAAQAQPNAVDTFDAPDAFSEASASVAGHHGGGSGHSGSGHVPGIAPAQDPGGGLGGVLLGFVPPDVLASGLQVGGPWRRESGGVEGAVAVAALEHDDVSLHGAGTVPGRQSPVGGREGAAKPRRGVKGCRERCPLCRRKCKANHAIHEAGTVRLGEGMHGHEAGRWRPRTGWAVHAWRETR